MSGLHGTLKSVDAEPVGDSAAVAAGINTTTLSLYDVSDFDEDGGYLTVGGNVYAYDSVDMDADTLEVTTGLLTAVAVDDPVQLWDSDTDRPVVWHRALVVEDGQDGDAIDAEVDHSLVPLLFGANRVVGESVTLQPDGDGWRVTAVHGKEASHDATTLLTGGFTTADDGQRMTITPDNAGGVIKFWTGAGVETGPGYINPKIVGGNPAVEIASPQTAAGQAKIQILEGLISFIQPAGTLTQFNRGVLVNGNLEAGSLSVDNDIDNAAGGSNKITAGGWLIALNPPTTTSAANVRIGAGGAYNTVTSLSAHKIKKQPVSAQAVAGVLKVTPTSWYDRREWLANGRKTDGLRRVVGAVAEDVEKHAPEFAEYDENGDLAGVDYRGLAVALISIVRDQEERIERLEREVAR